MRLLRTAAALLLATATALAGSPAGAAEPRGRHAEFPTGTSTSPDGRTALTDARGRELRLHGFNLDKYAETTEADVRAIAAHGFTLLRVAVSWTRLEPGPGRYDRTELDRLNQLLDRADRYGLLALIDFHQDVYGPKFGGGDRGIPLWATRDDDLPFVPDPDDWFAGYFQPAVQAAFRHLYDDPDLRRAQSDFYTRIARELRGHRSLLGYDLFNEPFGPIPGDPTDPADQVAGSAALERGRLADMYRRLIRAVRAADDRAWLFVEPTVLVGQGVPTQLPGFTDPRPGPPRLGYAPHFYDTAVESGADWDPAGGFVEAYVAAVTAYPAAHRLPVLIGEWGPPDSRRPGNTELVRRQVAAMETISSGWAMWYWCKGAGGYCALDPDGRPAPGDGPVFAPWPTALDGHLLSSHWTTATATYRLGWAAGSAGGPTELALPADAYPTGVRVTVEGTPAALVDIDQPERGRAGSVRFRLPRARPGTPVTVTVTPR
ncbi:cellulase family glycosylhydrolase [Kitasatospora sp. NBC_00240]|uniref:cellulase family glycosylhydrolase n=1 Tax=Kitasatospora sp. NBC_00240 TaxID=2903567 RepID=UPI00225AA584|nr:cellulase family glycosylhydrolase [Kitasatospora sp. NBC_00240]MCX5210448.1 cellulase family glycosylhydrolase [Kitasatospora sp. NBC_00240]